MLFFDVSGTGLNAGQVVDGLLEQGVRVSSPYRYGSVLRMVTHLDVTRAQCEEAVEALRAVVAAA
jgi:4-aminobutyrate aminotransferase-like enzyme